jgi:hypothetical protein
MPEKAVTLQEKKESLLSRRAPTVTEDRSPAAKNTVDLPSQPTHQPLLEKKNATRHANLCERDPVHSENGSQSLLCEFWKRV